MTTRTDGPIRQHVLELLKGGHAHVTFDQAVEDLPARVRGVRPHEGVHSPWELLEHLRLAQWDILEFSRDPNHESPEFPDGYWPATPEPPDEAAWDESVRAFRRDFRAWCDLVADESVDLFVPIPQGDGQTVLREALVAADHQAYHLGELVIVRRLLGAWKS